MRIAQAIGGMAVLIALMSGCQPSNLRTMTETQAKVEEAKDEAERAKSTAQMLESSDQYTMDVQQAEIEASTAESKLKSKRLDEAYVSAMQSLSASQRIFRQFYLERVAKLAEQSKKAIEDEMQKDSDTPLKKMLPELDRILDVANQLQTGQAEVSSNTMLADLETSTQTDAIIVGMTKAKIESDVSFDPGKYMLSGRGNANLRPLAEKIIAQAQQWEKDFPGKWLTINIKVVGYTDEQPFRQGTTLVKNLTEGVEDSVPKGAESQRKFLNQRLALFRAQNIFDNVKELLLNSGKLPVDVEIVDDIVGKGEEIPEGVSAPYPQNDPRRRMCKVYSYVIAK